MRGVICQLADAPLFKWTCFTESPEGGGTIDKIIRLTQAAMTDEAAWLKILVQLGISETDWGNVATVELTVKTINITPS